MKETPSPARMSVATALSARCSHAGTYKVHWGRDCPCAVLSLHNRAVSGLLQRHICSLPIGQYKACGRPGPHVCALTSPWLNEVMWSSGSYFADLRVLAPAVDGALTTRRRNGELGTKPDSVPRAIYYLPFFMVSVNLDCAFSKALPSPWPGCYGAE